MPDLQQAMAFYGNILGQVLVSEGLVGELEALAWDAPAMRGAACCLLRPPRNAPVFLRLVQATHPADYEPGRHFGWNALEFSVADADTLHELVADHGLKILSPPECLEISNDLYALQAKGFAGEWLRFIQILRPSTVSDLPVARCKVDRVFIAVLANHNQIESIRYYNRLLDLETGGNWNCAYQIISEAFVLPSETFHRFSTCRSGRNVLLEVDQYPRQGRAKPRAPASLNPSIALVSVLVSRPPEAALWLSLPRVRTEMPYCGRTVEVPRGPDGELLEIVW
ncbi:VOC family protein [Denitratisoma oestradiolicum]|uniref:VOC domain-containing protein n=1 Tax=Denitratisoma oestradiolicum TaxID=311182 RepID=A0A6S6YP98_9PROT|nr:VOC family protein [Denitratisoma oestradiolicum]CAB1369578.1 conserved protein of unknown function [Denitratisoma oestradiolicum]